MTFSNVYNDADRAKAYATLEYPGTYYLAFRDLPAIIAEHATGSHALDFGCGAGRSTRFLKKLGFAATGIDISGSMIDLARAADPDGDYVLTSSGDLALVSASPFDLVFSAFAFDNIPGVDQRTELLRRLGSLLTPEGRIILLGSTPEIYIHEWASFSTCDFPENRLAKSGETVRIIMKDVADQRPVVDLVWFHEDYMKLFAASGLELVSQFLPLGRRDEPYPWLTETTIAPWVIYVLKNSR
jgi:SAM-dependent methyltransferase